MDTYHGCLVVVKYKVSSPGASRARNELHAGRVICRVTREAGETASHHCSSNPTSSSSNQECPLSTIEKVARYILLAAAVVVMMMMIKMLCYYPIHLPTT